MAAFLLEQDSYYLHYTHEQIAGIIGLSRVTVSKVLSEFAKKKYVYLKYREIEILDQKALLEIIKKKT